MEPVLAVRQHREKVLQRQLADSQRLLEAEQVRYQSIDLSLRREIDRFGRRVQPGPLDMDGVCLDSGYLPYLECELEKQGRRVAEQDRRVAENMDALLQASRDRKALEMLRDNMRAAFLREMARKEQNAVEETAMTRHLLRQMAEAEQ